MALLFGELREVHDECCLGRSIQHHCSFSLTQVDANRHLTNDGYLCDSVSQFMGLVSAKGIRPLLGLSGGRYFKPDLAPLESSRLISY